MWIGGGVSVGSCERNSCVVTLKDAHFPCNVLMIEKKPNFWKMMHFTSKYFFCSKGFQHPLKLIFDCILYLDAYFTTRLSWEIQKSNDAWLNLKNVTIYSNRKTLTLTNNKNRGNIFGKCVLYVWLVARQDKVRIVTFLRRWSSLSRKWRVIEGVKLFLFCFQICSFNENVRDHLCLQIVKKFKCSLALQTKNL